MSEDYKQNIKDHSTWMRGLNIVLFTVIYSVTEIVLVLVVIFQFLSVLLTRQTNDKLLTLGMNISTYMYQILSYVTFNTHERPFPFADFPAGAASVTATPVVSKKKTVKKKVVKKKLADKTDDTGSDDVSADDVSKTDD